MMHLATKKFNIRKIALVFCLVTATIVLSGCGRSSETEFQRLVRQSNCTTADQIYSDYQNNEVAAQQKYQDRVNRVCGIVEEIELNVFNDPIISLKVSGWGSVGIGGVDSATAANISKGSLAVFECSKINELLGNPVMMECRLAPAQNVSDEAASDTELSTQNESKPNNAMAFAGKYPSEKIGGYGILDSPDLQSTIQAMPNGSQIWSQILSENEALQVETPNHIFNPGPYQAIVIHKCEAHNCGGLGSRQLHIEYFPGRNPNERQAFVCILSGYKRQVFAPWGDGAMDGDECTEGGFFYGD